MISCVLAEEMEGVILVALEDGATPEDVRAVVEAAIRSYEAEQHGA